MPRAARPQRLVVTKSPSRGHLLRLLGVSFGVAVGVGEMIGSGILRIAERHRSQPARSGRPCPMVARSGARLPSAPILWRARHSSPRAGGAMSTAHRAYGDVGGLVVGWSIFASHLAGIAAASVVFADFLGLLWPPRPRRIRPPSRSAFKAYSLQRQCHRRGAKGRAMQERRASSRRCCSSPSPVAALWLMPANSSPDLFAHFHLVRSALSLSSAPTS